MSVQIGVAEVTGSNAAWVAARIEKVVTEEFDSRRFAENFAVLAEAAGGSSSLRQLALHLAFQGRFTDRGRPLVPAVVRGVHQALSVSKGREAATTPVRGGSALAVGAADMMIPEGWDWLPLVSVAKLESGHTPSRNHADYWDGGIPWIGIRDAKNHNYGWIDATEQTVSAKGLENSSARLLPAGTVCLSRTASVGYVTIMRRSMATSQDFVNWVCSTRILPEYLMQLLRCEVPVLKRFSKGAVHQTIYFPEVKAFHISLPPLAEQKRIVARVDQLMALIDDLEAKQTRKREVSTQFTKASLEALTTAETHEEFDLAWKRVIENFPTVIDRAERVNDVRGAIRNLAMRGVLTEHEPGGVPARALLERVEAERQRRIRAKEARGTDALPPVSADEEPFPIPCSWAWTRLGNLCWKVADGPHFSPKYVTKEDGVPFLSGRNIKIDGFELDSVKYVTPKDHQAFCARTKPEPGDILYTKGGTTGVALVNNLDFEFSVWVHVAVLKLDLANVYAQYVAMALNSPHCYAQSQKHTHGIGNRDLGLTRMVLITLPLPPLAEQKRIVAKVEHLMKLCDDLEAKLRRAEERASKLVEAVVQEMVAV